jgi:hypothetical protein
MDQAQSTQGALSQWVVAQLRYDQPFFVADDDVFNHAAPVDQNADLAADIRGEFHKAGAKLMGAEFGRRYAPPVEALQSLDVT